MSANLHESTHGLHRHEAGLHLLYLKGSWEDMAEAHGKLLLPQIRRGLIPFFEGFIERHLHHGPLGATSSGFKRLAALVVERGLAAPIANALPEEQRRAVSRLAQVTGFTEREAARALSVPDAASILGALIGESRNRALRGMTGLSVQTPACTAVMLGAPNTRKGHLLHGRNLDYDCLGTWDTHRVVSFNQPKDQLAHVSFTTAGAFTSGLTGMNEAHLFVGCNTSGTWDVRPNGLAFHALHTRILSEASSILEAIEILRAQPRASGFNLHISDGKTGESCVVEYSAHHHHTRWLHGGRLVQTNHYQTEEMAPFQAEGPKHTRDNSQTRLDRLNDLVDNTNSATLADLANLMRDRTDPEHGPRPVGHIVACPLNVQSVVANVTLAEAYVSNGEAPAMDSDYVGFNLHDHLKNPDAPLKTLRGLAPDTLTPEARASVDLFKKAYMSYIHHNQPGMARDFCAQAHQQCPGEPAYPLLAAMLSLRLAEAEPLRQFALSALPLQRRPHARALAMTMAGYAYDLEGDHSRAVTWYKKAMEALKDDSDALAEHLQERLQKPYSAKEVATLRIDFIEPNLAGF